MIARALVGGAVVLAALTTACGGADTQPSAPAPPAPIEEANVVATGDLTVTQCVALGDGLFDCFFQGAAQNRGPGCAANVSGTTSSYRPGAASPLDSESWISGAFMRSGDQIVYKGTGLLVPTLTGWSYRTQFQFQNARCP